MSEKCNKVCGKHKLKCRSNHILNPDNHYHSFNALYLCYFNDEGETINKVEEEENKLMNKLKILGVKT